MMAEKNGQYTSSKTTESTYRPRHAPTADTNIYYPESDGKPMAETERHRDGMIGAIQTLSRHYIDASDVCVSGNLMMYHEEGKDGLTDGYWTMFGDFEYQNIIDPDRKELVKRFWNASKMSILV